MKVVIACDHGGLELKEDLRQFLAEEKIDVTDYGTHSPEAVDYPDFAFLVAEAVARGLFDRGIMIDGAGIGSCMVANKVPGVRAAMAYDLSTARNSREHNDANVLTLGGRLIGKGLARDIVKLWLTTDFPGGRHARRVNKINEIDSRFRGKV